MGHRLSAGWARPLGQQLWCDADEHLSDVLLLADCQGAPQLMGRNLVVGLAWGRRSGGLDSHRD
jgi:hypothetical protein